MSFQMFLLTFSAPHPPAPPRHLGPGGACPDGRRAARTARRLRSAPDGGSLLWAGLWRALGADARGGGPRPRPGAGSPAERATGAVSPPGQGFRG
jgi:hypothetical protein